MSRAEAWRLPQPVDHTDDDDQVIGLLEMAVADEVEPSDGDYAQYVRDDWGWRHDFLRRSAYSEQAMFALKRESRDEPDWGRFLGSE